MFDNSYRGVQCLRNKFKQERLVHLLALGPLKFLQVKEHINLYRNILREMHENCLKVLTNISPKISYILKKYWMSSFFWKYLISSKNIYTNIGCPPILFKNNCISSKISRKILDVLNYFFKKYLISSKISLRILSVLRCKQLCHKTHCWSETRIGWSRCFYSFSDNSCIHSES